MGQAKGEEGELTFICRYCGKTFDKGFLRRGDMYCGKCFREYLWKSGSISRNQYVGVEQLHMPLESFDDRNLKETVEEAIEETERWVNAAEAADSGEEDASKEDSS